MACKHTARECHKVQIVDVGPEWSEMEASSEFGDLMKKVKCKITQKTGTRAKEN